MAEVGIGQVARLELDRYDDTTVAYLAVHSPVDRVTRDRRVTPISTVSQDERKTWTGVVPPYDVGGLWYHVWTVTGMGYARIVHEVPVIHDALVVAGRQYATTAELAAWMRDSPPPDAERMLEAATRAVDSLLKTARYPVDADGEPTEVLHQQALRDATCELVSWWNDTGDASGALSVYGSLSAGSISVGRATAGGGAGGPGSLIGPAVRQILDQAGLTGHPPAVRC